MLSKADESFSPQVVLAIGAHPDDLEFIAGGSIAKWAKAGATIYYLILTTGNRGAHTDVTPKALAKVRRQEQQAAAQRLGVAEVFFAEYEDCCLANTEALRKDIVRAIRHLRPDTVVTIDPTMIYCAEQGYINHPDHRAAGQATLDAVFPLARDRLSFPDLITAENLLPHEVSTLLLFNLNTANFYSEISEYLAVKLEALQAHASQFPAGSKAPEQAQKLAKENGANCGATYAESFVRIAVS